MLEGGPVLVLWVPVATNTLIILVFLGGCEVGGYGSGWSRGRKSKVEESLVLATKNIRRTIGGGPGSFGSLSWSRGGEPYASIFYSVEEGVEVGELALRLRYSKGEGETKRSENYPVRVVSTVPTYGGRRWWFLCPLCDRRAAKLYLPPGGRLFGCRTCHRLTYESVHEAHKFDALFRDLAVKMGPGWTPGAVKASLKENHSKRDLRLLDAAIMGGKAIQRVYDKMNRKAKGKT